MKKRILRATLLLLVIISLSACDFFYMYAYQATNATDVEMKIRVKTFYIDSVYTVAANETKELFTTIRGPEGMGGPFFREVSFDLYVFEVMKDVTVVSSKNYLDNSYWHYDDGLYSTVITDDEFDEHNTFGE